MYECMPIRASLRNIKSKSLWEVSVFKVQVKHNIVAVD